MQLLSDDLVFLRLTTGGLEVVGLPDELDFTEHTAVLFPELTAPTARSNPRRPKRSVRPEDVGMVLVPRCRPTAVVLITVAAAEPSRLVPVDADDALLELVPNVLLTEPSSSQAHLDALAQLVQAVPCFRLSSGCDVTRLPDLVSWLLA